MNRRRRMAALVRGMGKGMDPTRVLGSARCALVDSAALEEVLSVLAEQSSRSIEGLAEDFQRVAEDLSRAFEIYNDEQPTADLNDLVARDTIAINPHLLRPRRSKVNNDA